MTFEGLTRLASFWGVFLPCAAWEFLARKREFTSPRPWRWAVNFSLLAVDILALRLLMPVLALDMAGVAASRGWGLLNSVAWSFRLKILVAFVFLDLVIYLQHRAFHKIPALWRLHMVHHTDLDLDATTGVRFHPVEIMISMAIKVAAVAAIGAPALAVLIFEVVLNATSLFNHSNVAMPGAADRFLRLFLVTPDMHRVHHSVIVGETNSNFSFNLPWWDRLLGTYNDQPAEGHQGMTIGLPEHRDWRRQGLPRLLALPFIRGPVSSY